MFNKRKSGILAHPTSFPSPYGIGDLGSGAYSFIDFLHKAKQTLWQILPLGPTGFGDSPYQSFSSFAGNFYLISPEKLLEQGLLNKCDIPPFLQNNQRTICYGSAISYKLELLYKAYKNFASNLKQNKTAMPLCSSQSESNFPKYKKDFAKFTKLNKNWLDDYSLFAALKDKHNGLEWFKWDKPLALRKPSALKQEAKNLTDEIGFYKFVQYEFFRQWSELKTYANSKGIDIVGDIPIFAAHDSTDVWANPELFFLDEDGIPTSVAGVPPDYFSKTGQLWGNPLYNWDVHAKTGYSWWCERIKAVLNMVDIVRLDHFRGFESYWAIPYGESTAINGKWEKGPGKPLFDAIEAELGNLPIIAEDLGLITESVESLRKELKLPGMRVLQFAFDPTANSSYLPHNYENSNTVVYTGTHDNDTALGWYSNANEAEKDYMRRYLNVSGEDVAWDLIRAAVASVAIFAITPLQDIFGLGSKDRMNTPGEHQGCWSFRYTHDMLTQDDAEKLAYIVALFGRQG